MTTHACNPELIWHYPPDQPLPGCTSLEWEWLNSVDSLTARLRRISDNSTRMELLSATWQKPYVEEQKLLENADSHGETWVREIIHWHRQQAWVWARVIIPAQTLHITQLDGNMAQPIGDILFQDPHLKRTELTLASLPGDHPYQRRAAPYSAEPEQSFWARRSFLWFHHQPLLAIEVFLPAFFIYVKN